MSPIARFNTKTFQIEYFPEFGYLSKYMQDFVSINIKFLRIYRNYALADIKTIEQLNTKYPNTTKLFWIKKLSELFSEYAPTEFNKRRIESLINTNN